MNTEKPWLWNVYTSNGEICSSASYWVPCVDLLDEKSTWELEFSIPKFVKNIGTSKLIGQNGEQNEEENHGTPEEEQGTSIKEEEDDDKMLKDSEESIDSKDKNIQDGGEDEEKEEEEDRESDEEEEEDDEERRNFEESNNPILRDVVVCCSEYSNIKELPHPIDLTKKKCVFQIINPVAPHHVGSVSYTHLDVYKRQLCDQ